MNAFKRARWSPYLVGTAIGILSWATFLFMDKTLGVSTTFVRAAGLFISIFASEHVAETAYFAKYLSGRPAVDWQAALVVALALGAVIAARLGGARGREAVPSVWARAQGPSRAKRYLAAFAGGFLVLFGARLAGGCTSGHAISGGLQLALSSWLFTAAVFAAGIPTAFLLYRSKKQSVKEGT